jgi:hypothetical protein
MTINPNPEVSVQFIDNPHAPEVFADEVAGFFIHNGSLRLTLVAARCDHTTNPAPINRVVVGRVALPIPAAQALALGLFNFLKKRGFDPTSALTGGETRQ